MKVIKNGEMVEMTYKEICQDLGFWGSERFIKFFGEPNYVEITENGEITCIDEDTNRFWKIDRKTKRRIKLLINNTIKKGYKPSKGLKDAIKVRGKNGLWIYPKLNLKTDDF